MPDNTSKFLERMADALDPDAPTEKDAINWIRNNSKRHSGAMLINVILTIYCRLQGTGFIVQLTPIILEQNSIPYVDKEKLVDKTLRNGKKKQESICQNT